MKICPKTNLECLNTGCGDIGTAVCALQNIKDVTTEGPGFILPTQPFYNYGWLCPRCGRGNSPSSSTCPCMPLPYFYTTCTTQ